MKNLFLFLFLFGAVHFSFAQQQAPFETEVRRLSARLDSLGWNPGSTVVTGSSTIRMWKTLTQMSTQETLINTGFGGSTAADLDRYLYPLVLKYEPKRVFIYEGDNDLWAGIEADAILDQLKKIVLRIHLVDPEVDIYLIEAKPSPSRWEKKSSYIDFNSRLQAYCLAAEKVNFVATWESLLDATGQARPELYLKDQLHLNEAGYKIWDQAFLPFFAK